MLWTNGAGCRGQLLPNAPGQIQRRVGETRAFISKRGALRIDGKRVEYYNSVAGSFGL